MGTTISTEQAQALFLSLIDFDYRVETSDGVHGRWGNYFHSGRTVTGYLSPEEVARSFKGTEFRVETE